MKQTLNIFLDMEFTCLSPDAQIISIGMVSDDTDMFSKRIGVSDNVNLGKSFYAEFKDFDINRCDDWVKENVVKKLLYDYLDVGFNDPKIEFKGNISIKRDANYIKKILKVWLSQFSEYNIQFIVDCGTFDWYHFINLIADWEKGFPMSIGYLNSNGEWKNSLTCPDGLKQWAIDAYTNDHENTDMLPVVYGDHIKLGLPILPENISPVPMDLNDLIAFKKGISVREAFDLDRDELFYSLCDESRSMPLSIITKNIIANSVPEKHVSISDAKVIKAIYNKLA